MSNKHRGFTLIELMIAVAIVGVLVAIAYPSYTNSLIKGSRAAAKSFLMEIAQKQQQFLLDNRAYASEAELVGAGLAEPPEVTRFYEITVVPNNAAAPRKFTATATPKAGTRQASDGTLSIDESGKREPPEKW